MRGITWFVFCMLIAVASRGLDAPEIVRQVDEVTNPDAKTEATLTFYIDGKIDELYRMTYYTKDNNQKVIVRFSAPVSAIGNDLLMLDRAVYRYDKGSGRIMRMPSNLAFGGTGFAYGDVMRLNLTDNYIAEVKEETDTEWRLELKAKDRSAPYSCIDLRVDKKNNTAIEQICYSSAGKQLKTITYSDAGELGGRIKPRKLTVITPYAENEVSVMEFHTEESKVIPDRVYIRNSLPLRLEEKY